MDVKALRAAARDSARGPKLSVAVRFSLLPLFWLLCRYAGFGRRISLNRPSGKYQIAYQSLGSQAPRRLWGERYNRSLVGSIRGMVSFLEMRLYSLSSLIESDRVSWILEKLFILRVNARKTRNTCKKTPRSTGVSVSTEICALNSPPCLYPIHQSS